MLDVFGLPLHPLVVHAVVVLLPLSALGLIACVLVPRLRTRYSGLTVLGLAASTVSAFVAAASGSALAEQVGTPETHMALGAWLPWVATLTLVPAVVWYVLQRGKEQLPVLAKVFGALAGVFSAAAITLTILVGHSGATAVWGGTTAAPAGTAVPSATAASTTPSASASPSTTASPSASTTAGQTYTLDQVKQHNTAQDCWAAINGGVYDLTEWIGQHPGGSDRIIPLCGTDASSAFNNQHGGQGRPESQLTRYFIGDLAR